MSGKERKETYQHTVFLDSANLPRLQQESRAMLLLKAPSKSPKATDRKRKTFCSPLKILHG